jgi:hypothetical protein
MPLEDNFADSGYPRDLVNQIISGFAQFSERGKVHFTQSGARLTDRHAVLLYLAALQGFYLIKNRSYDGARLSEIEHSTCIPGRYLRQAVEELERSRFIEKRWGRWTIREAALPIVKTEFDAIRDSKKKDEKKEDKKEEKKEEKKEGSSDKSKTENCAGGKTNVSFSFSSSKD